MKTLTRKQTKLHSKPWISQGLIASIKTRSKLYKQFLRNPNPSSEATYKTFKNKLHILLRTSKRNFYDSKFESAKGNLQSTWKLIKEVINKRKTKLRLPTIFNFNGKELSDPLTIANKFCEYFTNIGPNLASKIKPSNIIPETFLTNRINETIFLEPVTEDEIIKLSTSFKSGKSPGFDGGHMADIKSSIDSLAKPLSYIFNLSISTGTVPNNAKIAKLIPIYKSNCHTEFSNYRPISILPAFSKFFERIIYNRLIMFIDKHNVLYCMSINTAFAQATQLT